MKKISANQLVNAMIEKGYKTFTAPYSMNIIGVRSENSKSDQFDDELHVMFLNYSFTRKHFIFKCTTDPGKHWLMNPLNKNGTLITVPGQYRGVFKIGYHNRSKGNKKYKALEQVKPMTYVRDNNKDGVLDFDLMNDPSNLIEGNFKTNIHRASKWKSVLNIGYYSAGCTVIQDPEDFNHLMMLCAKQEEEGLGDQFTYTLLNESDI